MENQNSLIRWIGENSNFLKLKIENLTWVNEFFPGKFDLMAKIEINGREFVGWGFGGSQIEALSKAFAEAAERAVLSQTEYLTSNGLAAHTTIEKAKISARNELLERDLILSHFYTEIPFRKIDSSLINQEVKSAIKKFSLLKIDAEIFELGNNGVIVKFSGRSCNQPFGIICGAAVKEKFDVSITAAVMEAARRAHKAVEGSWKIEELSLDEFNNIEYPKFVDHGRLAANLKFSEIIEKISFCNFDSKYEKPKEISPLLTLVEIIPEFAELKGCPLFFAKAESEDLQDLFLGAPTPKNLNFKRLSQFAGREITWENLENRLPHFMD